MAIAGAAQWSMGIPSLIKQSASSVFAYRPSQLAHHHQNPGTGRMHAMQDSLSRSAGSFMNAIPYICSNSSSSSSSASASFWADQWLENTVADQGEGEPDLLLFQGGGDIPSGGINGYSCCASMPGLKELTTLLQADQYSPPPSPSPSPSPPYRLQDYGTITSEEMLIQLPPFHCHDDTVVDPGISGWLDLLLADPSPDLTGSANHSPTSLSPPNMTKSDYGVEWTLGGSVSEGDTESSSCILRSARSSVENRKRKYDDMDNNQSGIDASYPSKKQRAIVASSVISTTSTIDRAEEQREEKELCAMLYRPHLTLGGSVVVTSQETVEAEGKKKPSSATSSSSPSPSKGGKKSGTGATDAQSVAARTRREKISQRMKTLQTMLPNGEHLDMVATLGQTLEYIRFLQHQISELFHGTDPSLTSVQYDKWKDFM